MMRYKLLVLILLLAAIPSAMGENMNSSSYRQNVIVSAGGESLNSSSYRTSVAMNIINMILNSSSYINKIGFFHTILLANNQPCTSASQCEGGFCCSSLCKSSSCPTGEDTASGGGSSSSSSSGGGGGGFAPVQETGTEFSVTPESIRESIELGVSKTSKVTVQNTGTKDLDFSISIVTVGNIVSVRDSKFSIAPGAEKSVDVDIIGARVGSYFGSIDVKTGSVVKSVPISVDVSSNQSLFDVKLDIPSAYKKVKSGDELKAQITLLNVGAAKQVDVTPTYIIKDKYGRFVYESSETFAVEKQLSYVKTFQLPEVMEPGDYVAVVEVRYLNLFAVSSDIFSLVSEKTSDIIGTKSNMLLAMGMVAAGLLVLFAYLGIFRKKKQRE